MRATANCEVNQRLFEATFGSSVTLVLVAFPFRNLAVDMFVDGAAKLRREWRLRAFQRCVRWTVAKEMASVRHHSHHKATALAVTPLPLHALRVAHDLCDPGGGRRQQHQRRAQSPAPVARHQDRARTSSCPGRVRSLPPLLNGIRDTSRSASCVTPRPGGAAGEPGRWPGGECRLPSSMA